MAVYAAFGSVSNERNVRSRKKYRSSTGVSVFEKDLIEDAAEDGTPPWLTQEEFLEKYRVHRDSFHLLVDKIRDHSVFQSLHGKKKQKPVAFQLMVFLFYVGTSGSGSSNPRLRSMFGIGRGTAELYKRRCVKAIRSLRPDAISWPDETEREEIAKRVMAEYGWLQCIAVADGTLFPLTYAPQSKDAPDYHGRKHMYSLSVMIVNDDRRKIRAYMPSQTAKALLLLSKHREDMHSHLNRKLLIRKLGISVSHLNTQLECSRHAFHSYVRFL